MSDLQRLEIMFDRRNTRLSIIADDLARLGYTPKTNDEIVKQIKSARKDNNKTDNELLKGYTI